MERLNDFHVFCSNVEANQEVLQFSQTSAVQIQPLAVIQDEFIELSDYSIKTEDYIVTLSQNVVLAQQDPITNVTFLDDTTTVVDRKVFQPIVAHIDISLKKNDEDVQGTNGPPKSIVTKSKSKSIASRKRPGKKMVLKVITDETCDGQMEPQTTEVDAGLARDHVDSEIVDLIERIDDDFDDDEADDVIVPVVYESHEQFAGFPKVIIKDSRLHIRGSALLDLMSR